VSFFTPISPDANNKHISETLDKRTTVPELVKGDSDSIPSDYDHDEECLKQSVSDVSKGSTKKDAGEGFTLQQGFVSLNFLLFY
jgi:hypothetical protein